MRVSPCQTAVLAILFAAAANGGLIFETGNSQLISSASLGSGGQSGQVLAVIGGVESNGLFNFGGLQNLATFNLAGGGSSNTTIPGWGGFFSDISFNNWSGVIANVIGTSGGSSGSSPGAGAGLYIAPVVFVTFNWAPPPAPNPSTPPTVTTASLAPTTPDAGTSPGTLGGDAGILDGGCNPADGGSPSAVPEPGTMGLLGSSLIGLYVVLRRRS